MGEICRQVYILTTVPPRHTRVSTFTWILHKFCFICCFIKGSERGNSVHMTLMGLKKKKPYLEIWYKSKVIIFKSKLGSDSLARLVLQHRLWGDAPRPTYPEAILQSVQTGAAGAGFALRQAGTEKRLGSDTCARKPNTLHRDLVLLWPPFCPLPTSPSPSSHVPPLQLLQIWRPSCLLSTLLGIFFSGCFSS